MSKNVLSTKARTIGATAAITVGLIAGGAGIAAAGSSLAPHAEHPDGPGRMHGGPIGHGAGTVTAVSATSLTVKSLDGASTTYTLSSSTTFAIDRNTAATAADVTVGSRDFVMPSTSDAGAAASVHIEQPRLAGTVQSVSGGAVTIADEQGFWHTVDVSGSTSYSKSGATASVGDVTVGTFVMATGTIANNHTTLDATSVSIGMPTPPTQGSAPFGPASGHHKKG